MGKDFNKIYDENYKKLYSSFRYKIDDVQLLEEMINDTFLQYIRYYDSERSKPITFLFFILTNKIKQYYSRKKKVYFEEINDYSFSSGDDDDDDDGSEYDYEIDKKIKSINDEIYSLEKWKDVAIMFFISGVKIKDISYMLDVNENTIKTRISLIKKIIRKKLC